MRFSEHAFWSALFLLLYIPVSTLLWLYDQQGILWVAWLIGLLGVGLLNISLIVLHPNDVLFFNYPKVEIVAEQQLSRQQKKIMEVKKDDDIPVQPKKRRETSVVKSDDEMYTDVDLDKLDPYADDPFS